MTMTREKKTKVKQAAEENEKVITGVFEGGGVRGIGLIGAAGVFLEKGYRFNRVAGNSAGAIVASLIAGGYSAMELRQIMMNLDYSRFMDKDWKDKLPFGMAYSLFAEKGIYEGKYLRDFMKEKLAKAPHPIRTFRDVKEKDGSYRIQMIATDISRAKLLVLPQDIADYGINPDDLEVADAVRMSVSIPYFFEPVQLRHVDGTDCYIVDGGIVCNFPVWIYDDDIEAGNPPVGFCLVDDGETRPIHGVVSMFAAILETMLEARDKRYIADEKLTTVQIPTLGIQTCDFHLSGERQEALYLAGRNAAVKYIDVMSAGAGSRSVTSRKLQMRSPESRRLHSIFSKPAKKQSVRKRAMSPAGVYDSLIQKVTAEIWPGIDWQLIACQVNKESSFNPRAVSSCGAIGLLQLLPVTAQELGLTRDEYTSRKETCARASSIFTGSITAFRKSPIPSRGSSLPWLHITEGGVTSTLRCPSPGKAPVPGANGTMPRRFWPILRAGLMAIIPITARSSGMWTAYGAVTRHCPQGTNW